MRKVRKTTTSFMGLSGLSGLSDLSDASIRLVGIFVLVLVLFTNLLSAANTVVTQNVYGPDNTLAAGTAVFRISAPCQNGSVYVAQRTITVNFTTTPSQPPNGDGVHNFWVSLVPNDACVTADGTDDTSYQVVWTIRQNQSMVTQTWYVTTSGTPLTVPNVIVNPGPFVNSPLVQPFQINATGLANGTYCLNVVSGKVIGLTTCSGSGGSLSWSSLTSGQWAGLTSGQWASLTN